MFYTDGVIISLQELSFSVRVIYPFSVRSRNCLFTAVTLIPAASAQTTKHYLHAQSGTVCHMTPRQ